MIKEKDFIEIEYTGKIKETNEVFDTTDEEIAKKNNIYIENAEYKPIIICVGKRQIIKGLDKSLINKEVGKKYIIEVKAEEAYGKRNAKLIQLISTSKFIKQNVQPIPGLQVEIDGIRGQIKTVSGGRTIVDFNHPLAGKDLVYEIKINRIVKEDKEKIATILKLDLNIKDADISIEEGKAKIFTKEEIPEELRKALKDKIKELIPTIKEVEFTIQKEVKKRENLNMSGNINKTKGG